MKKEISSATNVETLKIDYNAKVVDPDNRCYCYGSIVKRAAVALRKNEGGPLALRALPHVRRLSISATTYLPFGAFLVDLLAAMPSLTSLQITSNDNEAVSEFLLLLNDRQDAVRNEYLSSLRIEGRIPDIADAGRINQDVAKAGIPETGLEILQTAFPNLEFLRLGGYIGVGVRGSQVGVSSLMQVFRPLTQWSRLREVSLLQLNFDFDFFDLEDALVAGLGGQEFWSGKILKTFNLRLNFNHALFPQEGYGYPRTKFEKLLLTMKGMKKVTFANFNVRLDT